MNTTTNLYQLIHAIARFEPLAIWRENKLLLIFTSNQIQRLNKLKKIKLNITIRQMLFVIRPIEKPGAWICINGRFKPVIPEFDVFLQFKKSQKRFDNYLEDYFKNEAPYPKALQKSVTSWQLFFESISPHYINIIKTYNTVYWWRLLQLLNRHDKTALDLAFSTPAVFVMLANIQSFKKTSHGWRTINSLIKKRQNKILDYIGYPGCKSVIKILRKVPDSMLKMESLIFLRKLMQHPENLKILQHIKKINTLLLILLGQTGWQDYLSVGFYIDVSNLDEGDLNRQSELYFSIKDTISMFQDLQTVETHRRIQVRNIAHLNRLHELSIERLYSAGLEKRNQLQFDLSLLPDTPDWISPLMNSKELYNEGNAMQHCIYTYRDSIYRNECFAFHVNKNNEQATLLINKDFYYRWKIVDIKKRFNYPVSQELYQEVLEWLNSENKKLV